AQKILGMPRRRRPGGFLSVGLGPPQKNRSLTTVQAELPAEYDACMSEPTADTLRTRIDMDDWLVALAELLFEFILEVGAEVLLDSLTRVGVALFESDQPVHGIGTWFACAFY